MGSEFFANPLFGVATTVIAYAAARAVHRQVPWAHPLLTTCGVLIAMLVLGNIPYESYARGGQIVQFFLGPAVVALAVPLYRNGSRLRANLLPLATAVAIGAVTGVISVLAIGAAMGGSLGLARSMAGKSATTPIAMDIATLLGGDPRMAALSAVLAGLLGAIVGPRLLRMCGVRHDLALGVAMGAASHGIGTSRLLGESDTQASASAAAMAFCGICTAVACSPLKWVL